MKFLNRISFLPSVKNTVLIIDGITSEEPECIVSEFDIKKNRVESISVPKSIQFSDLGASLSKGSCILICINGKGTLKREVKRGDDAVALAKKIIPVGDFDKFLWSLYPVSKERDAIWLVRKREVEKLLEEFENNEITVTGLYIGDGFLSSSEIDTEYKDSTVTGIEQNILTPLVKYHYSGLSELQKGNTQTLILGNREGWEYRSKIHRYGRIIIIAFFVLLLVNYIAFNYYYKLSDELDNKLSGHHTLLETVDSLENLFNEQKAFLEKTISYSKIKFSELSDRIALAIPDEVNLTSLQLMPAHKKKGREGKWSVETNVIQIIGLSPHPVCLNNFFAKLKKESWIKTAEIESFNNDEFGKDGKFSLKLSI